MASIDIVNNLTEALAPIRIPGKRVDTLKPPKTIFNFYMEPAYDDFRQYLSNYYLYLPFVGIIGIDSERYVNHYMSCKLMFDIRTGSMKYDLLSDNVLQESHTGQIRVNFPITAATPYAASMNKMMSGAEAVVGAAGVASGNLSSLASVGTGLMDVVKPIQKKSTGGFTPSVNIFDSLHVYLMVETPEIYYGDGIVERYGLPDNRYVTLGELSGYVELNDVDLHVTATDAEIDEIRGLLSGGVVI